MDSEERQDQAPAPEAQDSEIYMPQEAATATSPEGKRLVFFTVPQLDLFIKRTLANRHKEYRYRWAFHPGHQVHVLFFGFPDGTVAGIAIPEGAGDAILEYMDRQVTQVYITTEQVQATFQGNLPAQEIARVVYGNTLYLPDVQFERQS